jgi:hypothetical protein
MWEAVIAFLAVLIVLMFAMMLADYALGPDVVDRIMSDRAARTQKFYQRRPYAIAGIIVLVLIFVIPYWLRDYVTADTGLWFVVQTFAGNWSPENTKPGSIGSNYWFAVLGLAAMVINLGALVFLWDAVSRVRKVERRQLMRLADAFNIRDAEIQNHLVDSVMDTIITAAAGKDADFLSDRRSLRAHLRGIITQSFNDGDNVWKTKLLPPFLDGEDVNKLVQREI